MTKNEKIMNQAIEMLGLDKNIKSDPQIICNILKTYRLYDFEPEYKPIREFLSRIKEKPQPLTSFIDDIKIGLLETQPAIVEFIQECVEKEWLSSNEQLIESLHLAYIMEALTTAISNNNDFLIELEKWFFKERRKYGIKTYSFLSTFFGSVKATGRFFEALKIISIDPALTVYRYMRENKGIMIDHEKTDALYKNRKITFLDKKCLKPEKEVPDELRQSGIQINILEAAITEYKSGNTDNAITALALRNSVTFYKKFQYEKGPVLPKYKKGRKSQNKIYEKVKNTENYTPNNYLGSEWNSLYTTWNACFVFSNIKDFHVTMPKLFLPSQLSVKPSSFMFTRVMSLWLTLNYMLFRRIDRQKPAETPANYEKMKKAWGFINRKYSKQYFENTIKYSWQDFMKDFKSFFRFPWLNYYKYVFYFLTYKKPNNNKKK